MPATEPEPTLVSIIQSLIAGEIGAEHAVELASAPEVAEELTLDFVIGSGGSARKAAASGEWQAPVTAWPVFLHLLEPQAQADPGDLRFQVAVADYVYIVTEALKDIPDARLLRKALDIGERAIDFARAAGLPYWVAVQADRLGALHLLPYVRILGQPGWEGELARWQYRAMDAYPDEDPSELRMPEPRAAFKIATSYLEASLTTDANRHEGFTHKQLAQALQYRMNLGDDEVKAAAIIEHARAALEKLEPDRHEWRAEAAGLLDQHGEGIDLQSADAASGLGDSLVTLRMLRATQPDDAADIAERLWAGGIASENDRLEIMRLYLEACWFGVASRNLLPSGLPGDFISRQKEFELARRRLVDEFASAGAPQDPFKALLGLAARGPEFDSEASALELVEQAFANEQDETRREINRVAYAVIGLDHGSTAWEAESYPEAALRYFRAAEACSRVDLGSRAREALARGLHAVEAAGYPADPNLISSLYTAALSIEAAGGEGRVARSLRICWDRLIASAFDDPSPSARMIFAMMGMAKGPSFGRFLDLAQPYRAAEDPELESILAAIAQTGSPPGAGTDVNEDSQEYILTAIDDDASFEGRTPAERSANLQRKFDKRLRRNLLMRAGDAQPPLMLDEAAELLDQNSVLLMLYSGRTSDQEIVNWVLTFTKDLRVTLGVMKGGEALATQFGVSVAGGVLDDLGLDVANARENVRINPGRMRPVVAEGADELRKLRMKLMGGLEPTLQKLRAEGFDHLAICAHGSTHFLPWHLLTSEDCPLAEEWTVTYLPSVDLLRRRRNRVAGDGVAALGLTFEDDEPHGQRGLPHVAAEMNAIAKATGARLFPNEQATERSLALCFQSSKWLHIATHGRHRAAAPAFQALFLAPDSDSDGILNAFELLAFDLSNIELVTLSACETALGRVDISDNLRGLPASLFQAGVQTVVGTLWEVNSEVSAFFFTRLYEQLASGDNRVAAFAAAQRLTRERHPAYFHWGAFHYSGAW